MANRTPRKPQFVDGGTVQAGDGIYVERPADRELLELCLQGEYAFVLTSRQMGKSSLMINTLHGLERAGVQSVVIDLSGKDTRITAEQWYYGLLEEIIEQLMLPTDLAVWWPAHAQQGHAQRLMFFLREVVLKELPAETRVVIFVDEIDSTLSFRDPKTGTSFTDDFFAALRAFYNDRSLHRDVARVSFVLLGVATPSDLMHDPKRTPFNIGRRVELDDFTLDQARPLLAGFALPEEQARQILEWVFHWTGGHPYLTLRLCKELAARQTGAITQQTVDDLVAEIYLGEKGGADKNLGHVRDMLTRRDRAPNGDLAGVLDTYRKVLKGESVRDEERSQIKSYLKLSGVVRREQGLLKVRNPIYRHVFNEQWVKAHITTYAGSRVRKYRKAALVSLAAVAVMALISWFVWEQRQAAVAARGIAERKTVEANRERARAERAQMEAECNASEAKSERDRANAERNRANNERDAAKAARRDAEISAQIARDAELRAKKDRDDAIAAKEEAELERGEALVARAIADYQRIVANEQRKLAEVATTKAKTDERTADAERKKSGSQSRAATAIQALNEKPDDSLMAALIAAKKNFTDQELADYQDLLDRSIKNSVGKDRSRFEKLLSSLNDISAPPLEAQEAVRQAYLESRRRILIDAGEAISGIAYGPRSEHGCAPGADKKAQCGVYVITASDDNQAKIWFVDADDKTATHHVVTLPGHTGQVQWAAFSKPLPDGQYRIVTASYDNTARVYGFNFADLEDAVEKYIELRRQLGARPSRAQRQEIEAAAGQAISLIDTLKPPRQKDGDHRLQFADFDPDGNHVIAASRNNMAYIWERREGFLKAGKCHTGPADEDASAAAPCAKYEPARTLKGHTGVLYSAFYSRQGDRIVTASADRTAIVWDAATGRPLLVLSGHLDAVRQAVFNHDGSEVATAGKDGLAIVWDVEKGSRNYGSRKRVLSGHTGNVWSITYNLCAECGNEERQQIVTASEDRTARVWNATAGTLIAELRGHTHTIWRAAFSADGQQVITASEDQTARIWETSKERRLAEFKAGEPIWLIYGPEQKNNSEQQPSEQQPMVATVGSTGYPDLWDADTGAPLGSLQPKEEPPPPLGPLRQSFNGVLNRLRPKAPPAAPIAPDKCAQGDAPDKEPLGWRPLLAWNQRHFVAVNIEERPCLPDRWWLTIWDVDAKQHKPTARPRVELSLQKEGSEDSTKVQRLYLVTHGDGQDELVMIYDHGRVEFRELGTGQINTASQLEQKLKAEQSVIVAANRAGTYLVTAQLDGTLRQFAMATLSHVGQAVPRPAASAPFSGGTAATSSVACDNQCAKALVILDPRQLWEVNFTGGTQKQLEINPNQDETAVEIRRADYVTAATQPGAREQKEYVLAVIEYWRKPDDEAAGDPEEPERYHAVKVLDAARKPTSVLRGHVNPIMLAIPDVTGARVLTVSTDGLVRISPDVLFKNFETVEGEAQKERDQKHRVSVGQEQ